MEIINDLLSDNFGYLNAMRNAVTLPLEVSASNNKLKSGHSKLSVLLMYSILAGGVSLIIYTFIKAGREEKKKI